MVKPSVRGRDIPKIWRVTLTGIAIGKAAIAGAGLALAGLGALDVAFAITAHDWLRSFQEHYVNHVAAVGGVGGAVVGFFLNR